MKRFNILPLLSCIVFCGTLHAAEIEPPGNPMRKLQRGFLNVFLSPIEISYELSKDKRTESFVPTWATGLGRGGLFMAGRALAGIWDLVTFPLPWPSDYEPIIYPEFPWEHLDPADATRASGSSPL